MIKDKTIVNTIDTTTILTCSCSDLLPKRVSFLDSMLLLQINMNVVTVPPRNWRPKALDKLILLPPNPDVDDKIFLFQAYGLAICRTRYQTPPSLIRNYLILCDEVTHNPQLQTHLNLRDNMDITDRDAILQVIQTNWDAFDEQGVSRPILGY